MIEGLYKILISHFDLLFLFSFVSCYCTLKKNPLSFCTFFFLLFLFLCICLYFCPVLNPCLSVYPQSTTLSLLYFCLEKHHGLSIVENASLNQTSCVLIPVLPLISSMVWIFPTHFLCLKFLV